MQCLADPLALLPLLLFLPVLANVLACCCNSTSYTCPIFDMNGGETDISGSLSGFYINDNVTDFTTNPSELVITGVTEDIPLGYFPLRPCCVNLNGTFATILFSNCHARAIGDLCVFAGGTYSYDIHWEVANFTDGPRWFVHIRILDPPGGSTLVQDAYYKSDLLPVLSGSVYDASGTGIVCNRYAQSNSPAFHYCNLPATVAVDFNPP